VTNIARCIYLSVLGSLLLAAASYTALASSLPDGFADTLVNRPDGRPWDNAAGVAFAENGRMFVWERTGRVWLLDDGPTVSEPLIDLSDEVSSIGSLGLTGLALDPQFARNGFLYLFYTVDAQQLANCDVPASSAAVCGTTYRAGQHASGSAIGRLVRYQLVRPAGEQDFRAATTVNYASRRILLGETPDGGDGATGCVVTDNAHGPGALAFGSDGTLFVGCGDGAGVTTEDSGSDPSTQYRQALAARLMTPAENVGAFRAQLVDSLSGKILRLDAATGDGVPGNPFYDPRAPRAPRSRVWVLGLHDPQHFTVRPGSGSARVTDGRPGTLYIGEVGYSRWEALVVARDGRMNFGWPLYEGVGNETTNYASLPTFNLSAPNPLFPKVCSQRYFQFRDLITADSLHASWPNPCQPSIAVPATDDVFVRDRPTIDWLRTGPYARWAAFDNSGEPLALSLGTPAPDGASVPGPVFGGTASIGGVWYQGGSFPAGFRNVYYHADSGGEWIKAFEFDTNDNPVAVLDFLGKGGQIRALGNDPRTGELYYITGLLGSEVHRLAYSPTTVATVTPAAPSPGALPYNSPSPVTQAQTSASFPTTAPSSTRKIQALAASSTSNWSSGDIGGPRAAGSYTVSGSTFTVKGSGSDIYNAADAFQFVSQALTGDGSITARVVSQTNTNAWAKAGVMIRETLVAGSTNAFVPVTPQNGVVFQDRATTGGSSATITFGPIVAAPYWVRLVRAGNTFSAYASADGTTWTSLGQTTINMASQAYIGLAVTSHNNGTLSTALFDNVTVNQLQVTPHVAAITPWQSQQFTATVSGGVTWSVDGAGGGNSTVGTISSAGLYTPGSAAGAHSIVATSTANPSQSDSATAAVTGLTGVYTYHNDLARDGTNSQEYALTPATVNSTRFGRLFSCTVDGAIYAQPLWVANLNLDGVRHNVVFVATEHDSLYAFDADAKPCVQLWTVSLIDTSHGGASGEATVPSGPTGNLVAAGYGDITPEVGVTGTPVIDPDSGTLYVVSKSMNSAGTTFYQRLHAIDMTTGNEKPGSPVTIAGTYPGSADGGSTVTFNARQHLQRPGLALVNGTVYIGWAAHEDKAPWYGWMMSYTYNGSTFTQTAVFNTTPNKQEGGIWMSGGAPAADSSNNLYVTTGNGQFDVTSTTAPNNDYGDTVLKLTSNLTVSQYFTPSDYATLYANDGDLGAGGATVLPDLPAGSPIPHLVVTGGKDQFINVLNRDQLGGLGDASAVQKIGIGVSIFSTGAFWNNHYYLAGSNGNLNAYRLNASVPSFSLASTSPNTYGFPGSTPSVSAAGTANGVVWTLDNSRYCTKQSASCGPAVLHAHDAANLATEIWNSSMVGSDAAGNAVKFTVPTIANGKVYIGTRGNNTGGVYGSTTVSGELDVYGFKPN